MLDGISTLYDDLRRTQQALDIAMKALRDIVEYTKSGENVDDDNLRRAHQVGHALGCADMAIQIIEQRMRRIP